MDEQTNSNEKMTAETPEEEVSQTENLMNQGLDINQELDIEAALASVASLSDALAEHEAAEEAELTRLEAEADAIAQAQETIRAEAERRAAYILPRPPILRLERGQMTSVVPALLLIAIGSWWTFSLSTDSPPDVWTMALIGMGASGIIWCTHWLSSGRWARGSQVMGMVLLMGIAVLLGLSQSGDPGSDGWPLLITVVGMVIIIARFVSPIIADTQMLLGVLLFVTGLLGVAITTNMIDQTILDFITLIAPVIVIIFLVLIFIPKIARRRG